MKVLDGTLFQSLLWREIVQIEGTNFSSLIFLHISHLRYLTSKNVSFSGDII